MKDSKLTLSLIIPAYKRPDSLRRVIEAVQKQTRSPDQWIVVVRDTDRPNHQVLDEFPNIQKVMVSRPKLTPALNEGFQQATGDIVIFTDDDTEPFPNWLEKIERHYQSNPQVGAVGGRDIIQKSPVHPGPVGRINFWGKPTGFHHAGTGPIQQVHLLKGANMSFKRLLIKGFFENLKGEAAFNEYYPCALVLKAKQKIIYDPNLQVIHHAEIRADNPRYQNQNIPDTTYNMAYSYAATQSLGFLIRYFIFHLLIGFGNTPGFIKATQLFTKGRYSIYGWMLQGWLQMAQGIKEGLRDRRLNQLGG